MNASVARQSTGAGHRMDRQAWMAVLARASAAELTESFASFGGVPSHQIVKPPEPGAVMVEGRAGGSGRRFNIGEATVTKCVVQVGERLGCCVALGRDKEKARLAAIVDALLQDATWRNLAHAENLFDHFITPLAQAQADRALHASRKAAATKVEFFTLVRGDT